MVSIRIGYLLRTLGVVIFAFTMLAVPEKALGQSPQLPIIDNLLSDSNEGYMNDAERQSTSILDQSFAETVEKMNDPQMQTSMMGAIGDIWRTIINLITIILSF